MRQSLFQRFQRAIQKLYNEIEMYQDESIETLGNFRRHQQFGRSPCIW